MSFDDHDGLAQAHNILGEAVVNLRAMILTHRLQAANVEATSPEEQQRSALVKGSHSGQLVAQADHGLIGRRQLERYFFLISFASFLTSVTLHGDERFSKWVSVGTSSFSYICQT